MTQHQAWFGLKTKSLLVPTKRSWVRHVLNNGCGINVSPKSNIIMVIMVFSLPRNTVTIVMRKDKVNLTQGLALNTKMHMLRESSKQSCTSHGPLWSMLPLHWTDCGSDDLSLWSFAVKHSVWIYNCVPNAWSGLTPLELVTKEQSDFKDILHCHVWGCPVYVLEAKLQNDQISFLSGIGELVWENLLGFQMNIHHW